MIDISKIAVVLYDDLKPHCDDVRTNLRDLTHFKVHGKDQPNVFETPFLTKTLTELTKTSFEWAAVVALGNNLQDQSLMWANIEYAQKNNSPLSGHILDRGGYYHLHPQWFVIDLKAYQAIGCPGFEETVGSVKINTRVTERSAENMHDGYTPMWVRPQSEQTTEYSSDYGYFGLNVIATFIGTGHTIINVPQDIRQRKNYCYPEYNHDDIVKLIADPTYKPEDTTGPMWWFARSVEELTTSLDIGYYVLNTENLYLNHDLLSKKLDCFIGVSSGIKPVCVVGQNCFSEHTRVHLFDISPAAIKWQKHLHEFWDGDFVSFESTFNNFKNANPDLRPIYFASQSIDTNINWVLNGTGITREQFKTYWQKYKQMQVTFTQMNLLEDASIDQVANMINTANLGAYVWTSNLFFMDYLTFFKTNKWTKDKIKQFEIDLETKSQKPYVLENCGHVSFHGQFSSNCL